MTPEPMNKLNHLKDTYTLVNGWIGSADGKAGVLIGFSSLALGWLIDDAAENIAAVGAVPFAAAGIILLIGALLAALSVFPIVRLVEKPKSNLFFGDIAEGTGGKVNIGRRAEQYLEMITEENVLKDLSSQIIVNSIIAVRKYRYIILSFRFTLVGFLAAFFVKLGGEVI